VDVVVDVVVVVVVVVVEVVVVVVVVIVVDDVFFFFLFLPRKSKLSAMFASSLASKTFIQFYSLQVLTCNCNSLLLSEYSDKQYKKYLTPHAADLLSLVLRIRQILTRILFIYCKIRSADAPRYIKTRDIHQIEKNIDSGNSTASIGEELQEVENVTIAEKVTEKLVDAAPSPVPSRAMSETRETASFVMTKRNILPDEESLSEAGSFDEEIAELPVGDPESVDVVEENIVEETVEELKAEVKSVEIEKSSPVIVEAAAEDINLGTFLTPSKYLFWSKMILNDKIILIQTR
ncbi:unnamed protein product, partial [Oikopleura dioica]